MRRPIPFRVRAAAVTLAVVFSASGMMPALAEYSTNNEVVAAVSANEAVRVRQAVLAGNANSRHENGTPAIVLAVENRNVEIVEILLRAGARPDAAARDGRTALSLAAQYGLVRIASLLVESGANINKPGTNLEPPLIKAVRERHAKIARLLLEAGADPEVTDATGLAARDIAARQADAELIALFPTD